MADTIVSKRVHNFGAGPAALPLPVLEKAQAELTNFANTGMSVMEMSHRHKKFEEIQSAAEQSLRKLMGIPEGYKVLFLQGGASLQFTMVPMNFLPKGKTARYVMTGSWSEKALKEAQLLGDAKESVSTKQENYARIPQLDEIVYEPTDAYLHITSNNTIFGTEWHEFPRLSGVPLVADMSSDILSSPIDVSQFDLIYAGAQKNLGPSGLTVVIVREEWLQQAEENIPTMLRYNIHAKNDSRYNTPPTFAVYILGQVLTWMEAEGGVAAIHQINQQKAALLYDVIDAYADFYEGHAQVESRSLMNVTFRLPSEELTKQFLEEAKAAEFVGLAGHRSVGGCRASIYNAVPMPSCARLAEFMQNFALKHR